jgi:DNA helicase-2/ATP-dependent DNA helicase PcrA
LNAEQLQAVTATEGYVRVIAGAGSGKTRALVHRYAFLVNELGILPENILCVTFTNKAANEMRRRIRRLIGDQDTGQINTFHGFCVSVLKEESYAIHYPRAFLVLDNSDIDALLALIYEERGLTLGDRSFSDARDMIEIQKIFKQPEYHRDVLGLSLEELHGRYAAASGTDDIIFWGYLYQQRKCFGLDYNDLIIFTLHIFEQHEDIRLKWQKRLEYIMIDEFQDIDSLQYRLMEVLCGHHGNLFIVGDPDQTIYTWRGADVRYLLDFDRRFSPVETITMMKNYRSTPQILNAVNSLIEKNTLRIPKKLLPTLPDGGPVLCHFAKDAGAEAEWIASEISALHDSGVPYRDIAILYRAHYVTRALEEVLFRKKLPYHIYSGVQFFERAEIKDALSYLRMIVMQDDLSFRRVVNRPRRNIGRRRLEFLERHAGDHSCTLYEALRSTLGDEIFRGTKAGQFMQLIDGFSGGYADAPVSEILSSILDKSGYEAMLRLEGSQDRLDNLAELKQSVMDFETSCGEEVTLEHYLSHVALFTNSDAEDRSDKVKLMTVHAAKGLEFPHVFLCGMNEGVFPSRKTKDLPGMEEERRLAFVAMTRAEKRLYLSGAEGWNFDGSYRYPSRFVLDIDRQHLAFTDGVPDGALTSPDSGGVGLSNRPLPTGQIFQAGARIRHEHFGEGTIIDVDASRSAYVIQFDAARSMRTIAFQAKIRRA